MPSPSFHFPPHLPAYLPHSLPMSFPPSLPLLAAGMTASTASSRSSSMPVGHTSAALHTAWHPSLCPTPPSAPRAAPCLPSQLCWASLQAWGEPSSHVLPWTVMSGALSCLEGPCCYSIPAAAAAACLLFCLAMVRSLSLSRLCRCPLKGVVEESLKGPNPSGALSHPLSPSHQTRCPTQRNLIVIFPLIARSFLCLLSVALS